VHGLDKHGKKKWRAAVLDIAARLKAAMQADDLVIGGGDVKHLKEAPEGTRLGDNANAFIGGYRLWSGVEGKEESARAWRKHSLRGKPAPSKEVLKRQRAASERSKAAAPKKRSTRVTKKS